MDYVMTKRSKLLFVDIGQIFHAAAIR